MCDKVKEFIELGVEKSEAEELVYFLENYKYPAGIPDIRELLRPCTRHSTYSIIEQLESCGVLSCAPMLSVDGKSLVYGWQKYLHRYKGYYFQISATPSGFGQVETPNTRIDLLLRAVPSSSITDVVNFIATMNALSVALRYYDKTMDLLTNHSEVFDKFLSNSWGVDAKVESVLGRITTWNLRYKPNLDLDNAVNVMLVDGNSMYGLLSYSKGELSVLTKETDRKYKRVALSIPVWIKDVYDRTLFYAAFIEFILAYAGIRATHYTMYPHQNKHACKLTVAYNIRERFGTYDELTDYMTGAICAVDGWI